MHHNKRHMLATLAILALAAGNSQAQLIVYEGFDYIDLGDELIGKGGTTEIGLSGTWVDESPNTGPANDMYLKTGSLNFGSLATTGNHIGFLSNANADRYHRGLDATATTAISDAGSSDASLYFSFLFEKLQNNFGADREGFALMDDVLPVARFDGTNNPGAVGRHGFAVAAVNNSNLRAIAFDGTAGSRIDSAGAVPITTVNAATNTSTSNQAVNLIVGEILFNSGTDGADVFNLYYAADASDISDLTLAASIEADVDESLLNTLNLTRQVNVNYDEVRIGLTLADVLPAAAPAPDTFQVIITPNGDDFDFTWASLPDKVYDLVTSTDLADPISAWPVYDDGVTTYNDIPTTPPTNTLEAVPGDGPKRFFAIVEKDAPPPEE